VREEATQHLQEVAATVVGASTSRLGVDATPLLDWLSDSTAYTVTFRRLLRRTYLPVDPLVVDLPYLQEKVVSTDDTEVLRRNVDFFLEEYRGTRCVRFVTGTPDVWQGGDPPARMWAETTYLDNRPTIEANFGLAAGFTLDDLAKLPNNVDYLSSVRGLWFAYFSGPTLANLRAGTQILLGLPFAEEAGVIEEIRKDFSAQQGRLLVRDASTSEIVRSYTYPGTLSMETNPATGQPYQMGDTVAQFAPLVRGVEVADWVSNPRWFLGYLEQGNFLEVEKYFRFLVRVDSRAFDLAALLFVQAFVRRIKPTYTDPMFVVLAEVDAAEVDTTDTRAYRGKLSLQNGATGINNYSSGNYDQPRPAGGGFKPFFDGPDAAHPTYAESTSMFDVERLAPEDVIVGRSTDHFAGGVFVYDSVFRWDCPTYTAQECFTGPYAPLEIFPSPGQLLSLPHTATTAGSYTAMEIAIHTQDPVGQVFEFILEKNGVLVTMESITPTPGGFIQVRSILLTFSIGDVLRIRLQVPGAVPVPVYWESLVVTLGSATYPDFDGVLPAGDYTVYNELS